MTGWPFITTRTSSTWTPEYRLPLSRPIESVALRVPLAARTRRPRSQSLNHAVWTMTASAMVSATTAARPNATKRKIRRSRRTSERLADAEVDPPSARLRLAVDDQPGNRVELIAPVETDRTDR